MILSIRTDKPEAEVGLFDETGKRLTYETWQAHRELNTTIIGKLEKLLHDKSFDDLSGIVFYAGPGSFTGLRIGATLANTLASELDISIVGTSKDNWIKEGVNKLATKPAIRQAYPEYGRSARTTKPRK
jgi:tRNA threonylcarbamoyladenosine biosynthesis protein TsaB